MNNLEETISFLVAFEDYQHRFSDDHMSMKVETMIQIVSVDKTFTDFLDFQMTNPHGAVSIEVSALVLSKFKIIINYIIINYCF